VTLRRIFFVPALLSLLPLLAGCAATDAPGLCQMGYLTDLPLTTRHALLTPAFLNEHPTTMMLDTGSDLTIITRPAAERLNLALRTTNGTVEGIGGDQALYVLTAKTFRIGELHGEHLYLGASKVGMDSDGDAIDGIFGSDFLSNYDVDFDLPEQKVRLFKVVAGCNGPAARLDEPLYYAPLARPNDLDDKRPHVLVVIDGVRLDAIVDSGAESTAIFRNAARRLGLRLADLTADPHDRGYGVGPKARDEIRHIMAPIQVGDITISHLPVDIIDQRSGGDADMLLGLDFFARVHVWLSFHSHTMIMQYPAKPSPKLQSGLGRQAVLF
jgi:predicted aspartyl protease